MVRAVVPRDPAEFGHGRIGVIQAADQIVDVADAGVQPQQHRPTGGRVGPHGLLPWQRRAIEIG